MKKFLTTGGLEVPAVTTEQMREIDRIAMEETGPNLFQMMENAGRCLVLITIGTLLEKWKNANIVVLAGPVEMAAEEFARQDIWLTEKHILSSVFQFPKNYPRYPHFKEKLI